MGLNAAEGIGNAVGNMFGGPSRPEVALTWIAAIGRSPGPTATFSGCTRTVETDEQPAAASAAARAT